MADDTDDLNTLPWTILQGALGIPNPAEQPLTMPDLGNWSVSNLFPPNITNGQYLIPYNDPAWQAANAAPATQSVAYLQNQSAPSTQNVNQWQSAPPTEVANNSMPSGQVAPADTAAGLDVPAQPLSPQIIAQSGPQPPGGFPLQQNIQQGLAHRPWWNPSNLWWFRDQVNDQGPWDYAKHGGTHDQGNYNYGAVGGAMGTPQWILDRAAGWNQSNKPGNNPNDSKPGHWYGSAPYGDDPHAQDEINAGIGYARRNSP